MTFFVGLIFGIVGAVLVMGFAHLILTEMWVADRDDER